jgi:hypothetical protein
VAKKVAKKKKGARKAAPRRTRKAAPRAVTPHLAATSDGKVTWKRDPKRVVLTPLKAIVNAHIEQLRRMEQTDQVKAITETLERTAAELRSGCGLSMVVP